MKETMIYNAGLFQLRPYMIQRIQTIMKMNQNINACDLLFLGDSITEGFDTQDACSHLGTVVNAGVSGLTSDVLCYLIDECAIKFNPKHIIMMIGTNDLGQTCMTSPKQIALNIQNICEHLLRNIETDITVISPLPCDETKHGMEVGRGLRSNETLRLVFSEVQYLLQDRVQYIDCFNDFIVDHQVNLELYEDGLHLNKQGYDVYKQSILNHLIKS